MKLSLKFREDSDNRQNPILRAKIPVTILGLPFLSGIVAGDSSDLAFSIHSNFSSGPSLSLSYHPTTPSTTSRYPFSVSLKSGIGFFGSPHNSPLIFTAHFNLFSSSSNPNPNSSLTPTFSLLVKPQFGNFSFFKSVNSFNPSPIQLDGHPQNGDLSNDSVSDFGISNGLGHASAPVEKPLSWRDLKRNSFGKSSGENGILSGIFVSAKTSMPLTHRAVVNFRWGVNFPSQGSNNVQGGKTPLLALVVNKISLERVEETANEGGNEKKKVEDLKVGDLELLKGMCSWMRREMEDLQRENREIKQALERMRFQVPASRGRGEEREIGGKKPMPMESSSEFERWRSKKGGGGGGVGGGGSGGDNGHGEVKKPSSRVNEVESELQKAIKAASS